MPPLCGPLARRGSTRTLIPTGPLQDSDVAVESSPLARPLLPAPLREAILAQWRDWMWEVDLMGNHTAAMDAINAFRAAHGGVWPSAAGKRTITVAGTVWQEKVLGTWISSRRADNKAGRLPAPVREAILARWRDWMWDAFADSHSATMDAIDAFRLAHGGVWPARGGERAVTVAGTEWLEKVLGSWIGGRRANHNAGRLQAPLREAILSRWRDWVWELDLMGNHTAAMDAIDAFRFAHGGMWPAQVGKRTITVAGTVWLEKALGVWIKTRRVDHKAGRMPVPLREAILARWGEAWKWLVR